MEISFDIIYQELIKLIRLGLAEFSAKLTPNAPKILGVSVGDIRQLAKRYSEEYYKILALPNNNLLEINLLKGCVLGYANLPIEQKCDYISKLAKTFSCWQETDITASSIKIKPKERQALWDTAVYLTKQSKEFEIRQGITLILASLVNRDYIEKILALLETIEYGKYYYVDMAVAWLLSVCFVKEREKTAKYLFGGNRLDKFTYNKACQKIIESRRVSEDDKALIRAKK